MNSYFCNKDVQQLTCDGVDLCELLTNCRFTRAFTRHKHNTEFYRSFFSDCWKCKLETEAIISEKRSVRSASIENESDVIVAPLPPPRPSRFKVSKATSLDDLATYDSIDAPLPNTRKSVDPSQLKQPVDPTQRVNRSQHDRSNISTHDSTGDLIEVELPPSPSPVESCASSPRTSPSSGLLDNEHEQGRSSPPLVTNKLRNSPNLKLNLKTTPPLVAKKPPVKSVGKLNSNLISFVEKNMDFNKTYEVPTTETNRFMKSLPSPRNNSVVTPSGRNPSNFAGSRQVLPPPITPTEKVSMESPKSVQKSAKSNLHPSQSCTNMIDNNNIKPLVGGTSFLSKKLYASSQDDLSKIFNGNRSINRKSKEEERKRKEDKKRETKRIRKAGKSKSDLSSLPPLSGTNNFNKSGYFQQEISGIIQCLNFMVPSFVSKCVEFVEEKGLMSEGIYRKSPNAKERDNFIRSFDADNNLEIPAKQSEHTIAGALKWFFSDKRLNSPLIPKNIHMHITTCINNDLGEEKQAQLLRDAYIGNLHPANYSTFKYICRHLNKVSSQHEINKMNTNNLAVCWWPSLYHPDQMNPNQPIRKALIISIDLYDTVFPSNDTPTSSNTGDTPML